MFTNRTASACLRVEKEFRDKTLTHLIAFQLPLGKFPGSSPKIGYQCGFMWIRPQLLSFMSLKIYYSLIMVSLSCTQRN